MTTKNNTKSSIHKAGKKASVLIVSLLMVFVIFVLYIAISGIATQISSTTYVGIDAAKITEMKQESYKQRFFIETASQKIIDEKSKIFEDYAIKNLPKQDGKIILQNSTYQLDLSKYALEWMENQTNLELPNKIKLYNSIIMDNKEEDKTINAISPNNYTLIEKDENVYGIAKHSERIKRMATNNDHSYYYYWPHFTAKSDFFTDISTIYQAKDFFVRCKVTKTEDTCVKLTNKEIYKIDTNQIVTYSTTTNSLYVKNYVFELI
jgi:hypothetical protein